MKLLILNQGHTDNLGDKAIAYVMEQAMRNKGENSIQTMPFIAYEETKKIEFNIERCDNPQKNVEEYCGIKKKINFFIGKILPNSIVYIARNMRKIKSVLISLKTVDGVIIGGGELLKSHHQFTYAFFSWVFCIKKYIKCPIAIWGISGDERFNAIDRIIYSYVLKNCCYVGVRDKATQNVLKKKFAIQSEYAPDIVFLLKDFLNTESEENKEILFFVNDYEEVEKQYKDEEAYFETYLRVATEKEDLGQIAVAFTTQKDLNSAIRFADFLQRKHLVNGEECIKDSSELKKLIKCIGGTGTIVSGRMHAMILGLQYNKKIIPIGIKNKIEVFSHEWCEQAFNEKECKNMIELQIEELLRNLCGEKNEN